MAGVGTELKKIIPGIFETSNCNCSDVAARLDRMGVRKCEQDFEKIVQHLIQKAAQHRLLHHMPRAIVRSTAERWVRLAIERAKK